MSLHTILKPDVCVEYLKNKISEKVTYLNIPRNINVKSLEKDVKGGAVQFKEILEFMKKKDPSNYIMINADNKEMGYMAITYLEACRQNAYVEDAFLEADNVTQNDEYSEEDEKEEDYDSYVDHEDFEDEEGFLSESEYEECIWKVPVISMNEITQNLSHGPTPFAINSMPMQGEWNSMNFRPFWTNCTRESVCIMNEVCGMFAFSGSGSADQIEALSYFKNNERVYILNVKEQNSYHEDDYDEDDFMSGLSLKDITKNEIVLHYIAEEIDVVLPEEKRENYYKNILKGYFDSFHINVKKGFSYNKIMNIIFAMKNEEICSMIEKIVRYAIKDKKNEDEILLTNADFKFIDRFARTENAIKKQKCKSAKKRMMEDLIGMDSVKEQVLDTVNIMKFNQIRKSMNIQGDSYHNVHVMLGAPGTAKTTVAELMGQIMVDEKLLPDNRFICVNGAELKGKYVGHSAPKTKALFENYDVIVIDEAYSLVDDHGETDSFSKEAIAQLIIELEKHATDKLVIFAGYGGTKVSEKNNKMRAFIDSNPGIKSRINSTIFFESYTADEMVKIFYQIAQNQNFIVEPEAKDILKEYFATRVSDENFGNGREARSLLENSVVFTAKRVLTEKITRYSESEMKQISVEDIRAAIGQTKRANKIQGARNVRKLGFQIA